VDERLSTININRDVKRKFVLVGSSIIVFPALILVYMHYQAEVTFSYYVSILLILVFLIVLTGLYILFNIFDNVFSFAESIIKELTEQASQSNIELTAIKDLTNKAYQNRDFEDLLDAFLDAALTVTNSQIGSSFIVDPETKRLRLVGSRGIKGLVKGQYIDIDDSVIKHVIAERKPLLVKDIERDPRTKKKNDPKYGSPSFISIPIYARHKGDVTAVVNISRKKSEGSFDAKDENLLSTMLIDIKLTLENELLQSQIADYIEDIQERNIKLEQEITDRKRAEEIQKKLHEELMQAEKLATVGTFVAGIAHEVKNPLAIIIQGIEYLKTSSGSDALLADVVERIKKSAQRADTIVKGLLSFTRQISIQTEKVEVTAVIEETLSFVEHQINAKHITVIRQYSPNAPLVSIDSDQMKQAFANILLNSIEAMGDGGKITIAVRQIRNEADQPYLQISFADVGCGIPADKIEKVFDPFFTTKDNLGNTGLGLSITKGIIDKHHGTIRIDSKLQEGTQVAIELPVASIN
jgi:two-component system, cell cycle sensor histidine kinase and response regulator CckA